MTNWLITNYGLRRVRLHKSSAPSGRLAERESEGANKNGVAVSNETGKIIASEAARATLAAMKARHGAIILHVTGGWSKAALVLPSGEMRIGPRDILLGEVDGVAIFEMQITPDGLGVGCDYTLDVAPGVPVGFSLVPEGGVVFKVERVVGSAKTL